MTHVIRKTSRFVNEKFGLTELDKHVDRMHEVLTNINDNVPVNVRNSVTYDALLRYIIDTGYDRVGVVTHGFNIPWKKGFESSIRLLGCYKQNWSSHIIDSEKMVYQITSSEGYLVFSLGTGRVITIDNRVRSEFTIYINSDGRIGLKRNE